MTVGNAIGTGNAIFGGDLFIYGGDVNLGTGSATTTISGNGTGIGIGTTSPGALLSINGSILAQTGTSTFGGIISPSVFSTTSLAFYTSSNAAPRIFVDTSGNIGFGTTGPGTFVGIEGVVNLDLVNGNNAAVCHTNALTDTLGVTLGDCSAAPAQDYAEIYPVDIGIEFGDIVVAGERTVNVKDTDGQGNIVATSTWATSVLKKSGQPYQSAVVGVISNNYGDFTSTGHNVINNEDNPMPVALSGRVPVKVSLEGGPIQSGDPITTSSIPGVGMKATSSGETIGTALAPFDGWKTNADGSQERVDVGKVMVFVKLGYAKLNDAVAQEGGPSTTLGTSAWSVDQSSGKVSVNFFGDLRLNGNSIVDVKAITGMWGKWSIDENGKVIAKEVETEVLRVTKQAEVGTSEQPAGITIYDRVTRQPVCVFSENGALRSEAGACQSTNNSQPTTGDIQLTTDNQQPITTEVTSSSESTPTSSSTTTEASSITEGETTDTTQSPSATPASAETATQPSASAEATADTAQPSSETPASAETATAGETAGTASTTPAV